MTQRFAEVSIMVTARHCWPNAPHHREYLRKLHPHNFTITARFPLHHADRELEFHDLQDRLRSAAHSLMWATPFEGLGTGFGSRSCEQIAEEILDQLPEADEVRVREDEFCGGIVTRETGLPIETELCVMRPREEENPWASGVPRPRILTVCGSTRFADETRAVIAQLEREGIAVFSVGFFAHAEGIRLSAEEKAELDILHLRKIYLSDGIFVVNPGGYIGESTQREIAFTRALGREIRWLEEPVNAQPKSS